MSISDEQLAKIVKLCNDKIEQQRLHEAKAGYGEDYTDGRIVGQAAVARSIFRILHGQD